MVGMLAIHFLEMSPFTEKSKLEIFMQGTASPGECPNLAISGRGHKQWALLSAPVVHLLLTEGEKWFSQLEHSCQTQGSASSSLLPLPFPPPSLSQSNILFFSPVTAANVWVAIWLRLCIAAEVVPLHCTHAVLIVVNNVCCYCCCSC